MLAALGGRLKKKIYGGDVITLDTHGGRPDLAKIPSQIKVQYLATDTSVIFFFMFL